jgi:hypothetical protein
MNLTLLRLASGYILLIAAALAFCMPSCSPIVTIITLMASFFTLYLPPRISFYRVGSKIETLAFFVGMAATLIIIYLSRWNRIFHPTIKPEFLIFLWIGLFGAFRDIRGYKRHAAEQGAAANP